MDTYIHLDLIGCKAIIDDTFFKSCQAKGINKYDSFKDKELTIIGFSNHLKSENFKQPMVRFEETTLEVFLNHIKIKL